jgi:predicted MFS family arabinose efflux permease
MLGMLVFAFALSHAFRTLPTIIAAALSHDFDLGARRLGVLVGAFHLGFAIMQIPAGVALDRYGPRRTVASLFVVAAIGAFVTASAQSYGMLITGQAMIGIGCSPVLMGAMVFTSRRYPQEHFARVSGLVIAIGGGGMLITATPLAWLVEYGSWRLAVWCMFGLSVAATLLCWFVVDDDDNGLEGETKPVTRETFATALRGFVDVLAQPQARGIMAFGLVSYAVTITLRGLWIVPILSQRYGLGLVQAGNVVLAVSVAMMAGSIVFGWLDPGEALRRRVIIAGALITAGVISVLAAGTGSTSLDVGLTILFGFTSSFYVLQYVDARAAYPAPLVGRALATLNLFVFIGVSLVQFGTGSLVEIATAYGLDPNFAALACLATVLVAGVCAFVIL